ncbi:MAG: hypothetical protein KBC44_01925 [Candidatus Pacebacteria bacterium]|nr:hypothetical protein [Candidatus Paceibacterota bacterium]MBP9839720.1 hypothetical protein [Candidatus Paceibacterota bacterium]
MEQNFQTSFIPKKPLVSQRATTSQPIGLLTIIPLIIFFGMIIAGAGIYFYKNSLAQSLTKMENDLNLARNRFEDDKISQLELLDKRLRASSSVLNNHVTVSPIFQALQEVTMKTVRYTRFDYSITGDTPEIKVTMAGQTTNYKSIALQSELFANKKFFIDPVFSNLSLDEKGNVMFDLTFNVDPSFVNYNKSLSVEATEEESAVSAGETMN